VFIYQSLAWKRIKNKNPVLELKQEEDLVLLKVSRLGFQCRFQRGKYEDAQKNDKVKRENPNSSFRVEELAKVGNFLGSQ